MLQVREEQVADVGRVEPLGNLLDGPLPLRLGGVPFLRRRLAQGERAEQFAAAVAADLDGEAVGQFGQREVEPGPAAGAGVHRGAKTGRRGGRAVYGNEEGLLPTPLIDRVDVRSVQEGAVLHGDRGQIAGPHAEKRHRRRLVHDRFKSPLPVVPVGRRDGGVRREQEPLPRLRADGVAEEPVLAGDEPILAGRLGVGPAAGQIVDRLDLVEDHRRLVDRRADHAVAVRPQRVDQAL